MLSHSTSTSSQTIKKLIDEILPVNGDVESTRPTGKSVDIDSVEYQENEHGEKIRQALGERVGTPTILQVFIGGERVGG